VDGRFAHHTLLQGDNNPLVASLLYGRPFGSNFDSKVNANVRTLRLGSALRRAAAAESPAGPAPAIATSTCMGGEARQRPGRAVVLQCLCGIEMPLLHIVERSSIGRESERVKAGRDPDRCSGNSDCSQQTPYHCLYMCKNYSTTTVQE
jgi:hypothetical protein